MNLTVAIEGMHCTACVAAVKDALTALPGISRFGVELGSADVSFDEQCVAKADVFAAIRAAGSFDIAGFTVSD